MDTKQPEALAQECADYATSLRSTINVVKLEGRKPPISFLRAAELFERAAARIAELEALAAGYAAARLEIASLQERVQELGKAARDVNSRRVQELEAQLAAVAAPKKWAPEEVADGGRGIRWVTNEGVHGRPTDHDVREYLKRTPTANGCHCDDCKRFYAAASDVTAAPAQAGEYPELPIRYATYDAWGNQTKHGYNAKDMHAYVDADRAAQGAAQAAPVDAERLDYLQECGVTVEVLPGRPGWTFRIGGLHGTVHRSVRTAIDAARAAQKATNEFKNQNHPSGSH